MKTLIIINDPPYGFGLDDFQALNGLAGHQAGDRVLQEVARRLGGFSREPGFVSRLGGDVFGLWLTPREGKQEVHLEFKFYYQSQFDRSQCCVGYEAPLRWRHPEHGMVSPAEFIPVAEEAALMEDVALALEILEGFRSLGVLLAVDDFGTGHSSLVYLKALPVKRSMIDRAFVIGLPDNEQDEVLCRTMISMAHSLGCKVIAEGVETEAQADWLLASGCDELQGFLLGRPAPENHWSSQSMAR